MPTENHFVQQMGKYVDVTHTIVCLNGKSYLVGFLDSDRFWDLLASSKFLFGELPETKQLLFRSCLKTIIESCMMLTTWKILKKQLVNARPKTMNSTLTYIQYKEGSSS